MYRKAYLILFVFLLPSYTWSQDLCPPPKSVSPETLALKIEETDLSMSKAMKTLQWLENDSWGAIRRFKTTSELLNCTECFGLSFPNLVTRVKGTILRQSAQLEREHLDVAKLRLKTGSGNSKDVETAQERFDNARNDFCKFLETAEWVR